MGIRAQKSVELESYNKLLLLIDKTASVLPTILLFTKLTKVRFLIGGSTEVKT